jgi:branched-chain amino acid transport system substrate-binding protein
LNSKEVVLTEKSIVRPIIVVYNFHGYKFQFKIFWDEKAMKRLYTLLSVLMLASLVLAACGGTAPTEALATEVPPTEAPTEAAAPFECTDIFGCVDIAPGDPIHFVWIQSVSGMTSELGLTNINGGQLAIYDKGGELLGHPILYDGEDSLCNAEGGQAAGTKVAADPTVVAILGTTCASEARSAMPLIDAAGMVMISSSSTEPDLTSPDQPDRRPGYFRTAHNDLLQGVIAAEYAYNELGLRAAATVHDGSSYALSLQQVFADVFKGLGGTITAQEAINLGDTDFIPVLSTIAAGKPDILYFPIFEPEGNLLTSQKCEVSGLENMILMGTDRLFTSSFIGKAGSCAVGMYLSGPYVAGDAMADFLEKYNAAFGEGPASDFAPHAYDAMNIFFQAIEAVAVVEADGTVHIGRQALRDALHATKDFAGLTGNLSCNANGDCATGEALAVYQISQAMVDGTENLTAATPTWHP